MSDDNKDNYVLWIIMSQYSLKAVLNIFGIKGKIYHWWYFTAPWYEKLLPRGPQNNYKGRMNQGNFFFDAPKGEDLWKSERKSLCKCQQATHIHQPIICDVTYSFHRGSVSDINHRSILRKGCGMFWHTWGVPTHQGKKIRIHGTWRVLGRDNGQGWPIIVQ